MSLLQSPLALPVVPLPESPAPHEPSPPRKRTSSFCYPSPALSPNPRPAKAQRTEAQMGSLRRTETLLVLPTMSATASSSTPAPPTPVPYHRTLQYYKDQRQRRKRAADIPTIHAHTDPTHVSHVVPQQVQPSPHPQPTQRTGRPRTTRRQKQQHPSLTQIILPSVSNPVVQIRTFRSSSPLAPTRTVLPGRPVFPRSKPEPDLYRKAIITRMRCSPEGQKILHMGPRLALSIMTATKELERIVADQHEKDGDVVMADVTVPDVPTSPPASMSQLKGCSAVPVLTSSWVVVKGDDWEMVDCGA